MNKKGKEMNKKILKLLYRSFDDDLEEKEQKQLTEALENSEELRLEKEEISAQRKAISSSAVHSFKPFFPEKVMSRIKAMAKTEKPLEIFYESLKVMFRRLAIAGAVLMLALILLNLGIRDSLSSEEIFYASDATFEEILQLPLF